MAIFTINIEDSVEFDTGILDLNVYYGTVNNFPTNETTLKEDSSQLIERELLELIFNSGTKHFIALPSNISISQIININNLHEDITDLFVQNGSTITVTVTSIDVNYNLYELETAREYSDNFNLIIKISNS
jgi:hypothetical protein